MSKTFQLAVDFACVVGCGLGAWGFAQGAIATESTTLAVVFAAIAATFFVGELVALDTFTDTLTDCDDDE